MRKTLLIVNFLALCTLSVAANIVFPSNDTHAQSSQAGEQQSDREAGTLAAPTGDLRAGRGTYFAVVNGSGSVVRGTDVVESLRMGSGEYRISFNADVSKCAYTATVSTFAGPNGIATVENIVRPQSVVVRTFAPENYQTDRHFHLIVSCG